MNKRYIFSVVAVILLLTCESIAQMFPDYKERSLISRNDSSYADSNRNLLTVATEGSIDPGEYIVGPGDRLLIAISGLVDVDLNLFVNQEGMLFIPKVGIIDLRNTDLANAKEKITSAINKYYKNVDIYISLVGLRNIRVSLLGDVKQTSSYVLPGNARLADLIFTSKGLDSTSNYRDVKIEDKSGSSKYYDFLSFLRYGDRADNPMLREGDIVLVDKVDKVVAVRGEVKYPGVYEFVQGETAAHLIKLAGGFTSKARTDTIEIVKFNQLGKSQRSDFYSYDDLVNNNIMLDDQDVILIRQIPEYYIDRFVKVEGWVKYPGYYKIVQNKTTLYDIINEAGGFLKNASLTDAVLNRRTGAVGRDAEFNRLKTMQPSEMSDDEYAYFKAKSRQQKGRVVVDFYKLFELHDLSENVILKKDDSVYIPEAKNYITMLGQVVNPGNIIYEKELKVKDYLKIAGGFGWRAETGDVRVIRANSGEWIDADKVDSLYPGDTIWVPEKPAPAKFWNVFTTALQIVGQVASIVAATIAIVIATRR